ncbi:hypothetical protein FHG87_000745 [Trinorchestia longiramus]|nr:hypothetical protein FHG87_000745 [Trinorchestia longiramus]
MFLVSMTGFEPAVFLHEAETRYRTRAADHSTMVKLFFSSFLVAPTTPPILVVELNPNICRVRMSYCGSTAVAPALLLLVQILAAAATHAKALPQSTFSDDGDVSYDELRPDGTALLPLPLLVATTSLNKMKTPADKYQDHAYVQTEEGNKYFPNSLMGNFFDDKHTILGDRDDARGLNVIVDFLDNFPFSYAPSSSFVHGNRVQNDLTYAQLLNAASAQLNKHQTEFEQSTQGNAKPGPSISSQAGFQSSTKKNEYGLIPALDKYQPVEKETDRTKSVKNTFAEEQVSGVDPSATMFDFMSDEIPKLSKKRWLLRRWWKGNKRPKSVDTPHSFNKRQVCCNFLTI